MCGVIEAAVKRSLVSSKYQCLIWPKGFGGPLGAGWEMTIIWRQKSPKICAILANK